MVVMAVALSGCIEPSFTPMAQQDDDNLLVAHLYYGKERISVNGNIHHGLQGVIGY